ASDGLLSSQDVDRELVEAHGECVDVRVVRNDLVGESDVGFVERASRLLDRLLDEGGDLDESRLYLLKFLLEHCAHYGGPLNLFVRRMSVATAVIVRFIVPSRGEQSMIDD